MNGVIYARYSCEKQREESITGQIRDCQAFADRENISIVGTYKDEALSARTDKRPSFQRMIKDAMTGKFDCIIVWKGDRFSRNRGDAANYKAQLRKRGVSVLYAMEPNVDGPEAILIEGISESYAEFYSVELGIKVARGMRENALEGKWNGGNMPYGYTTDKDGKYMIVEDEAPLVRELFNTYVSTKTSILQIAKDFEKRGYVNREGKPFKQATLQNMLGRLLYAGIRVYNGQITNRDVPPIISEAMFNLAQEKMKSNKKSRNTFKNKESFLLSSILYSGETNTKFTADIGTSKTGARHYYYSNRAHKKPGEKVRRYHKTPLENAVVDCVLMFIKKKIVLMDAKKKLQEYIGKKDPDLVRAEESLKATNVKIGRFMKCIEDGIEIPDMKSRLLELNETKEAQLREITRIKSLGENVTMDEIESFFEGVTSSEVLTLKGKQSLIENFVLAVYIYEDGAINIIYKYRDFLDGIKEKAESSHSKASGSPNSLPIAPHVIYLNKYVVGIRADFTPHIKKYVWIPACVRTEEDLKEWMKNNRK